MKKHNAAEAIPPLKRAAELSPDSVPIQQLLGYALLTQGYAAEAIPHLEIARDLGALGIAQLENDEPAKAIVNLQSALESDPDNPDLLFYLSRAETARVRNQPTNCLRRFQTLREHTRLVARVTTR